jgi:hypothetical protein
VPDTDNPQASKAQYEFGINRAGGALYGYFLNSAVYASAILWYDNSKPVEAAKLPKLRAVLGHPVGILGQRQPKYQNREVLLHDAHQQRRHQRAHRDMPVQKTRNIEGVAGRRFRHEERRAPCTAG